MNDSWKVSITFESDCIWETSVPNLFDVPKLITLARMEFPGQGDVTEIRFF